MKKILPHLLFFLFSAQIIQSQEIQGFEVSEAWLQKIEAIAPDKTTIATATKRKILIFSKATGFYHWTIPHNTEVLKILAKKTNAFEIHIGYDITNFEKVNLQQFDAVILNNSNPNWTKRDLFYELLQLNTSFSEEETIKRAAVYEKNLMNYVSEGGGLMLLHGAITMQNNVMAFSKMTGGSFDYHPVIQEIHLKEVDIKHPLVKAFKGKGFTHVDEPYFFKNAYSDYNFRPLLYFETDKIEGVKHEVKNPINYVSWIKRHGKGRVFYSSPSHNAQSMEQPALLQFLLDGMQYVTGDLQCDDSPIQQ